VKASPDGSTIASGSYNNWMHLVDTDGQNTQFELNYKKSTMARLIQGKNNAALSRVDYLKKCTALDFHPFKNTVAVASLNCFFVYSG